MTTVSYKTGVIEVAPNAYAFIQENCATNAAFIVSDEGVLVIDSLMTPSLAGKLYAAIRNVTTAPIRYLINTHFHGDHVFGNQYFLPAPIVAHENCRTELQEKFDANMQRYRQREALIPELEQIRMTLPDVTFEDKMTIRLGDRVIEMSFLGRAHSNSDILTYLPDDKVLFVGDIAVHKTLPAFPDGHITKWLTVIDETAKVDADVVVPGHGPVGGKAEFEEARELLQILNSEIRKGYDAGLPEEETAKKVNVGKFSNFANQERVGQITQMAYLAYKGELQ
jgi:cyclase